MCYGKARALSDLGARLILTEEALCYCRGTSTSKAVREAFYFSQHNTLRTHQQERWPTTESILLLDETSDTYHRNMSMCYRMSFVLAEPPEIARRKWRKAIVIHCVSKGTEETTLKMA
jgi:hypothetical protein